MAGWIGAVYLNDDDVSSSERLTSNDVCPTFGLNVESVNGLVRINISCGLDGHNVSVIGESLLCGRTDELT